MQCKWENLNHRDFSSGANTGHLALPSLTGRRSTGLSMTVRITSATQSIYTKDCVGNKQEKSHSYQSSRIRSSQRTTRRLHPACHARIFPACNARTVIRRFQCGKNDRIAKMSVTSTTLNGSRKANCPSAHQFSGQPKICHANPRQIFPREP